MNLIYKKAIKDFKKLGWRAYLIIIVIIVSLGGSLGLYYAIQAALPMMDLYYDEVNHAEYTYQLNENTWINQSQLDGLEKLDEVDDFTGRLIWQTSTRLPEEEERKYLLLVGLDESIDDPEVYDYTIIEGDNFNDKDSTYKSAVIEATFAEVNDLDIEDKISIDGLNGATISISGTCNAPEFVLMTSNPEFIFPIEGSMAVVFLSKNTLKNYIIDYLIWFNSTTPEDLTASINYYQTVDYNNIAVTFKDDISEGNEDVEDYLEDVCKVDIEKSEEFEESYAYKLMKADVSDTGRVMMILMFFMSLMGGIIVFIIFNRYVNSQKQQIGILLALGYTRREIYKYFFFNVFLISIIAIPAGIFVGYSLGYLMLTVMFAEMTHLESFAFSFIFLPEITYLGLTIGLSLIILSTLLSIRKINKKIIAELIYEQEEISQEIKKPKKTLKSTKSILNRLVFKNLFTNKKRLFFTIAAMTLSLLIVSASQNLLDSMYYNVDRTFKSDESKIEPIEAWDLNVVFQTAINNSRTDNLVDKIDAIDDVDSIEVYTKGLITTKAEGDNEDQNLILQGVDYANSKFHKFSWKDKNRNNRPPKNDKEIVISSVDSLKMDKELGDEITIKNAGGDKFDFTIVGIHSELILTPYVTLEAGQKIFYNDSNFVDGVLIILENEADREDIIDEIYDLGNIEVILDSKEMNEKVMDFIDNFSYVMQIINIYSLLVSFFIVFYNSVMNIYDKNYEFGILRSFGYSKRKVFKAILLENILQGLLPIILAVSLTYPLTLQMGLIYQENFPLEIIIGLPAILMITIPPLLLYVLGSLVGLRTIYKQNLYEQVQTKFVG
jgi:putative ABC transport system permease protein